MKDVALLDTSCIVALLASWHEHHALTAHAVNKLPNLVIAAHTLLETYAALTRLPASFRLAPSTVSTLVLQLAKETAVVGLSANELSKVVLRANEQNVSGGRIYDFVIGLCAEKAKATRLLTWNVRHFQSLGLRCEVCSPADL